MTTHGIGMPSDLAAHDTAPPPLPPWLKGFLVTSKTASEVRRAGEEVAKLLSDDYFKLAYDNLDVPASMVKPGTTEVPYEKAESLLIPGCPGSVFVALRPDTTTVNVRILAEGAPGTSSLKRSSRHLFFFFRERKTRAKLASGHSRRLTPIAIVLLIITRDRTQSSSKRRTRWVPRAGPRHSTRNASSR